MTTTTQAQNGGRTPIEIDWKKVDFYIEAGCSGYEIAAMIGVHHETIYNRVEKEFGMKYTEYSDKKRPKGDASIKVVQYQKALKGDNSMLVWLGKNRLKQKDREKDEPDSLTNDLASLVKLMMEGKIKQSDHVPNV